MIGLSGVTAGALRNVVLFLGRNFPRALEVGVTNPEFPIGDIQRYGAVAGGPDCRQAVQNAVQSMANLGGGTVFTPAGRWVFATPQGAFKIFVRPRSGVIFRGEGPASIWQAADGLNTDVADNGFNFILHVVADEGLARVDNVSVADMAFDHNGLNNLVPAAHPNKSNIAVGCAVGDNWSVTDCTFLNNAGQQTLSFGNNTAPQKVAHLVIADNVFEEMGGSVTGNVHSQDHSSIYAQAQFATLRGNHMTNTNGPFNNTAIECHSSDAIVSDNSATNYDTAYNVVATVTDQLRTKYHHNVCDKCNRAVVWWCFPGFTLDRVEMTDNTFTQAAGSLDAFVDMFTNTTNTMGSVRFSRNSFKSEVAPGSAAVSSACITVGKVARLELQNNHYLNFPGRAVELSVPDPSMVLIIDGDVIEDCGTTAVAGNKQGIALNTLTNFTYLRIARCIVRNVAAAYMTEGITGNAPVTDGDLTDNVVTGVATPITWNLATNLDLSHTDSVGPITLNVRNGSKWTNRAGAAGTTHFIKVAGAWSAVA